MTDSATVKIDRAAKHVAELNKLLSEKRPFSFVVTTDTATGDRSTRAKKDEAVIGCAAGICGDAVHNLRSALDHAYWETVSPIAQNDSERRQIQFPFKETKDGFDKAVKEGFPARVSDQFRDAILGLRAYKEPGGNELLYLIHEFDILDKHKLLIPTSDYTHVSGDIIRKQVPDYPNVSGSFGGQGVAMVQWRVQRLSRDQLGDPVPPSQTKFERKLDVPIHIVFEIRSLLFLRPVVPTLNQLVDVTRTSVEIIRAAAP
jgi:hypothetical protein